MRGIGKIDLNELRNANCEIPSCMPGQWSGNIP